jgi:hypothetical protein
MNNERCWNSDCKKKSQRNYEENSASMPLPQAQISHEVTRQWTRFLGWKTFHNSISYGMAISSASNHTLTFIGFGLVNRFIGSSLVVTTISFYTLKITVTI